MIIGYIGDWCSKFMDMSFKSVINAEKIIFVWGMEDKETLNKFNEWKNKYPEKFILIENKFNQEDKGMNGKARNIYLEYAKAHFSNQWMLVCDPDELVEDLDKVKEFIQTAEPALYSVKMEHFIGNLGNLDNTKQVHFVPNRLFKISEAEFYPETEHPVLNGKNYSHTQCTTIWHLAYCGFMWDIKKRYENHLKKSEIHTPQFLEDWRDAHYFGTYPVRQINPTEIPDIILKEFGVNKDKFYFQNRGIELKHPIMVQQWHHALQPTNVLDLGCGRGPYLHFWNWFVGVTKGIEISEWACKNAFVHFIEQGSIVDEKGYKNNFGKWDLITAIDVLEHLDDEELDKALINMAKYGKKFIFSIPFENDPNLYNDKTHKQFHSKDWWINKIESYGIKIEETPSNWLFKDQILIGRFK